MLQWSKLQTSAQLKHCGRILAELCMNKYLQTEAILKREGAKIPPQECERLNKSSRKHYFKLLLLKVGLQPTERCSVRFHSPMRTPLFRIQLYLLNGCETDTSTDPHRCARSCVHRCSLFTDTNYIFLGCYLKADCALSVLCAACD